MKLFAIKPCSFGGKRYFIGDEVPLSEVSNPKEQEKRGVLAISSGSENDVAGLPEAEKKITKTIEKLEIPVLQDGENEVLAISLNGNEIQSVFAILQMASEEAVKSLDNIESEDVLIVIHATDNRTTVKKAAKKRAEQIASAVEAIPEIQEEPEADKDTK